MEKKAIAGVLLLAIVAWAELLLAPMLLMHAERLHLGHEMALSGAHDTGVTSATHHHPGHAHAAGLPCCPDLHKEGSHRATSNSLLFMVSSTPECADSHRCCFWQGPQSVPAPVRDVQKFERNTAPLSPTQASLPVHTEPRFAGDTPLAVPPHADLFGITLRI